jgi:hypothetical protein
MYAGRTWTHGILIEKLFGLQTISQTYLRVAASAEPLERPKNKGGH